MLKRSGCEAEETTFRKCTDGPVRKAPSNLFTIWVCHSTPIYFLVVVATPGGEVERASRRLASKRKREDGLTQQPVRHSLWEQGSLEACNGWLFGCLDGEVEALQQRN